MSSSFWTLSARLPSGKLRPLIDQEGDAVTFASLRQVESTLLQLRRLDGKPRLAYVANEFFPTKEPGKWAYNRTVML